MSALFWPGDERAGATFSESALLAAMVRVETAWLGALVDVGVAPPAARHDLAGLTGDDDLASIADAAEAGGNPVIPLVAMLRERAASVAPEATRWLHRGLTSQDVLDTAIVLCARDVLTRVDHDLRLQVVALADLADLHRATPMIGRTLTQHAVPITFGVKVAAWLGGLLDAGETVAATLPALPAQFGGAAGTLSAVTGLAAAAGLADPAARAVDVAVGAAAALGLRHRMPWHGSRAPVTSIGHALCACTSAWGRIANDVLTLSRTEIAELAEPRVPGRGGSSAMPQKVNPVLSTLIRRAALDAPAHQLQLLTAAAEAHDERPSGSWHVEWQALHLLGRHAVAAGAQATELLTGLQVDDRRMSVNLAAAGDGVLAERRAVTAGTHGAAGQDAAGPYDAGGPYDAAGPIVAAAIDRARTWTQATP